MWTVKALRINSHGILSRNLLPLQRKSLSTGNGERVMAIRREDINVWERRAPIAPSHVAELAHKGIKVLVQPSTRRAYTMDEYERAGAVITEDLSPASLIIGVKAVPIDLLIPDKTYAFFSHTIKAQEANMPLLDAMLEKNIRIVDYEKMVDSKGQRVCAFGKFAGVGGMINILHGLGLRLLALGHHTPFMYLGATHNYKNSRAAKLAIYELGEDIKAGKLPAHFGPLSFVFTGSGNVSQGAQEMFQELPHIYVEPHELRKAIQSTDHRKLIGTVVSREDYLVPKAGGVFDAEEYDAHPDRYRSTFAEKVAPYMSVLVNGTYWAPSVPRLLTYDDARNILKTMQRSSAYDGCPSLPHRLLAICDISADNEGSLEFMTECTTIEYPFHLYNIKTGNSQIGMAGDGVLICSIDNLPAQLPREATDYFGKLLLPWLQEMIDSNATDSFEEQHHLSDTVRNAIITSNGLLTENYKYIAGLRKSQEEAKARALGPNVSVPIKQRVLLLGSGFTVAPCIEYLTRDKSLAVTVASDKISEAEAVAAMYRNTTPTLLDVTQSEEKLNKLIQQHDVVISLLPYSLHHVVAKSCITHKTNLLTASYVLPPIAELHQSAVDAGIAIVNELGLDPGIDHLLAMECFDDSKAEGAVIKYYRSFCGGLPAPEHADNPLRYKFSWSPRAGLLSVMNSAKYLWYGKCVEVQAGGALIEEIKPTDIFPGYRLECYPNRDSTKYGKLYDITTANTILRGTLRYEGYSTACLALYQLGMYSTIERTDLALAHELPWKQVLAKLVGKPDASDSELYSVVFEKVGKDPARMQAIKDLGLLSEEPILQQKSPLDTLCLYLTDKLAYKEGERDMVLLQHDIGVELPDKTQQNRRIDMICYGDPNGHSAMARTVGLPVAIATKMVLDGDLKATGVVLPLSREIYKPLLKRLKAEGIHSEMTTTVL
ncbi:alpha-aminoadipic semialdehyde synthase, mitochondrial-like isoform X1 [Pocillopora damicornis]|uniref:alpha-aminoadipic semialdehyde synthase, mitochondrial-like isoform X1 n=2 Tax=Pocillopora damicornis TaxID=46731 RepID=UPI000F5582B4|nr:alpha-aminoadipic semialdehyde synthase, mitochondrial-like isoform X1 [Pocillopora damicornis]